MNTRATSKLPAWRRHLGLHLGAPPPLLRLAMHAYALSQVWGVYWDWYGPAFAINPIQDITFRTGKAALIFLVLSLAVTPAQTVLGWRRIQPLRRSLGLYAFFFASLHFLIFAVLDYGLDPALLQEAIFEKPYALVGFAAFMILLPLALTSTKKAMRRLGKRWTKLHRLVYLAAGLVILHYLWLVKADWSEPAAYGLAVALLLGLRAPRVRAAISRRRAAAQASGS